MESNRLRHSWGSGRAPWEQGWEQGQEQGWGCHSSSPRASRSDSRPSAATTLSGEGLVSKDFNQASCQIKGCWTPSIMSSVFKEEGKRHRKGMLKAYQDENMLSSRALVYLWEYFVIEALYLLPLFPVVLIRNVLVHTWELKASTSGDFEGGLPKSTEQVCLLAGRIPVLGASFRWLTSSYFERSWWRQLTMRPFSLREWVCENVPVATMHPSEASFPPSALWMGKNCVVLVMAFSVISAKQDEHNRYRCLFPFSKTVILKATMSKIRHWKLLSKLWDFMCCHSLFGRFEKLLFHVTKNCYSTSSEEICPW